MGHKRTETHDVRASAEGRLTAALITVSDRASTSVRPDSAGPALREVLEGEGYEVVFQRIVPDEQKRIETAIRDAAACDVALCVSAGGTGLGPRDVTPDATAAVCERMVPGHARGLSEDYTDGVALASRSRHARPYACAQRAGQP